MALLQLLPFKHSFSHMSCRVEVSAVSLHIMFQEEVAISSASSRCSIMWTRQNRIDYEFELSE